MTDPREGMNPWDLCPTCKISTLAVGGHEDCFPPAENPPESARHHPLCNEPTDQCHCAGFVAAIRSEERAKQEQRFLHMRCEKHADDRTTGCLVELREKLADCERIACEAVRAGPCVVREHPQPTCPLKGAIREAFSVRRGGMGVDPKEPTG